jgi:hypothetical protein
MQGADPDVRPDIAASVSNLSANSSYSAARRRTFAAVATERRQSAQEPPVRTSKAARKGS